MFLFGALLNKYEQTKKEKKIFKSFDTPRSNQFEFGNIRIIFNIHKMKKQTNRGKMNSWPVPFFFFSFRSAELILALASIVLCAVHTFIFKLSGQNSKGSRKIDITRKTPNKQTGSSTQNLCCHRAIDWKQRGTESKLCRRYSSKYCISIVMEFK